jgi:hypothetical protein
MRDYGGRVMAAMLSPARHEHIAGDDPALQHEREVVGPASRIAAGALRIDWAAISELTVRPGMRMRKVTRGLLSGASLTLAVRAPGDLGGLLGQISTIIYKLSLFLSLTVSRVWLKIGLEVHQGHLTSFHVE